MKLKSFWTSYLHILNKNIFKFRRLKILSGLNNLRHHKYCIISTHVPKPYLRFNWMVLHFAYNFWRITW